MKLISILGIALATFTVTNAQAHHSASTFIQRVEMTIEGTIVEYEWANPHVYLWVEEETENGELVTWEIEGQPPLILKTLGWTPETVKVGDRVRINANPARNPNRKAALMTSLELADETVLKSSFHELLAIWATDETEEEFVGERANSLSGHWLTLFDADAIGSLMQPKRAFNLTDSGLDAIESFVEDVDSPSLNCIPSSAPLNMIVPDIKSIEVKDDVVLIFGESDGLERTVHLNLDDHNGAVASLQGHSIGWWDEGALVIDTTHFSASRSGNAPGLSSGEGKHLIERLELNEEGTHLAYSLELEDPEYLAEPFIRELRWVYRPDEQIVVLPCDLENARRYLESL